MCTVMEEYTRDIIKETEEKTAKNTERETARSLFSSCKKLSYKEVKNSFRYLSEDEIKKIYEEIHQK